MSSQSLDSQDRECVVKEIEKDVEKVAARESLAVVVLCGILALVTVYVAIGEWWETAFYPDEGAYFTTTLGGVLPRWAVVANFLAGAFAHASSAIVVKTRFSHHMCSMDWLTISLSFNVAVVFVWFIALLECHQCTGFNSLLLLVPNAVSCYMAYDCVKDEAVVPSLLWSLKDASGLVKQKCV